MFSFSSNPGWGGGLAWLAAILVAGFAVAYLFTDRGGMRRYPYVGLLALVTGGLAAGYLAWSGAGASFWADRWMWGLAGAVLSGGLLALLLSRMQGRAPEHAAVGARDDAWLALVYGSAEGMLLSVLPVVVTWQVFAAVGWDGGWRAVVAGAAAVAASNAVIVTHHLGYRGYRSRLMVQPVIGCTLLSVAYLLTVSPIAAMGGHILLHEALLRRGVPMPPHDAGESAGVAAIADRNQPVTAPVVRSRWHLPRAGAH